MMDNGTVQPTNGTAIQRNWSTYIQKYQCFESLNVETKEGQMYHSLQWRFHEHRFFQTFNSVNQVSIQAAVTNWCYKFAFKEEEKEHSGYVDIFSEPSTAKPDDAE